MHADTPVILLLAAGEGSRFGGAKQLAPIAGEPMVRRVARMLLETDMPLGVVTGAYADEVEAVLDDLPLTLIRCEDWRLGMGHSLAAGVHALMHAFAQATAVLVCLADQPMRDSESVRAMLRRHQQAPDRVLATSLHGTLGPPALFPRDCFKTLASLSGQHGARAILQQEAQRMELFESEGLGDVDTAEDLRRLQALLDNTPHPTP
ncbi:nucleotidyltransferase family protein [Dyella flagellata]|uniref:Molybdopterin-guanine dinucleotide biosynthesis protein A n=1 Tax=Dyella flagellata TaxID=1867833 RepID=A0ABQ5X8V7_9GAMM|nr:nucleotidyltransferase family protein [Dyella flagellata]GLQ87503.1 molybdopterin-guanine dinucleotide biosynthesis protein A [Dyella flagellata]